MQRLKYCKEVNTCEQCRAQKIIKYLFGHNNPIKHGQNINPYEPKIYERYTNE